MVHKIIKLIQVFIFSVVLLSTLTVNAKKKRSNSQEGVVKADGVGVYEGPSFDAPIISYLDAGQKVVISKKTYKGLGGFGLFFKIRVRKGVIGYVADTDVIPRFKKSEMTKKVKENPLFEEVTKEPEEKSPPLYFSRYVGFTMGSLNFTEIISGKKLSAATTVFGLKLTGPDFILDEVPLDVDVLLSLEPPGYYDEQLASAPASGFLLYTSAAVKVPLAEWPNAMAFYSLGFMGTYSAFNFVIGTQPFDSQEMRIGFVGALSFAFRPAKAFLLQFDMKYNYETTQYFGYFATFAFNYK